MKYPGVAIIGCEKLAGIYSVNEGIVDAKGTGVQHLFFDGFDKDLVHSAATLIKDGDTLYYGNRRESRDQHPVHLKPQATESTGGYVFTDQFDCDSLIKTDRTFAWGEANIGFETTLVNKTAAPRTIEVYAYLILQPQRHLSIAGADDTVTGHSDNCAFSVHYPGANRCQTLEEGPTGFIYRTTGALLNNIKHPSHVEVGEDMLAGIVLGLSVTLPAHGRTVQTWTIRFESPGARQIKAPAHGNPLKAATDYWETYLAKGVKPAPGDWINRANQVAIKAAMINGFVPADLTGHYYGDGLPCYYARDALMVARAFLLSGHQEEATQVIRYLLDRERKSSGELFQRYNGRGQPSEGANNNVFHQLDSIGYLLKMIHDYWRLTGTRLTDSDTLASFVNAILDADSKNGLVGPEGGVNEGVFGPAFIVSSNMFIYGGLKAAQALLGEHPAADAAQGLSQRIMAGIEGAYVPGLGYRYGYVSYHDDLVSKYDTPQYFGLLYGFEDTANMRETHRVLLNSASFDGHGIGYSEQEYHHGPWTFNTAACAEYSYLIGDHESYVDKLKWLFNHANAYGQLPEAFSADAMENCYINPLVWACAEVVSALHIGRAQR